MIERHITFSVGSDMAADFERFFRESYAPAMSRSRGFVSIALLREAQDPTRYQMAFRFEDPEAAAGWRTSPEHEALQPALRALHSGSDVVGYEVIA